MNDNRSFQRLAGWTAIIAGVLMYLAFVVQMLAVNFDVSVYDDPSGILTLVGSSIGTLQWGLVLDTWGWYFLPIIPAFFLYGWLKAKNPPFVGLFTLSGLIHFIIAAVGATIAWAVFPALVKQYAGASEAGKFAVGVVYNNLIGWVDGALFGGLPTYAIWWLGIGWFLRFERRGLGIFMLLLGAVHLFGYLRHLFGVSDPLMIGFLVEFFIQPLFFLWLGIDLLRKPVEMKEAEVIAAAPARSVSASRA